MAKRKPDQSEDRYPIHRGPFLFAPHFLTVAEWFSDFNRIAQKALSDAKATATIERPRDGRLMLVKFPESEMTVDGDGGFDMRCVLQLLFRRSFFHGHQHVRQNCPRAEAIEHVINREIDDAKAPLRDQFLMMLRKLPPGRHVQHDPSRF
jgi:hypothetical protein